MIKHRNINKALAIISVLAFSAAVTGCGEENTEHRPSAADIVITTQSAVTEAPETEALETPTETASITLEDSAEIPTDEASETEDITQAPNEETEIKTKKTAPAEMDYGETDFSFEKTQAVFDEERGEAVNWSETYTNAVLYVKLDCYSYDRAEQDSSKRDLYKKGEQVSVTAITDTGYYRLTFGGYIPADYLTDRAPETTVVTTVTTVTTEETKKTRSTGDIISILKGDKTETTTTVPKEKEKSEKTEKTKKTKKTETEAE